jgi:hypothetical protein
MDQRGDREEFFVLKFDDLKFISFTENKFDLEVFRLSFCKFILNHSEIRDDFIEIGGDILDFKKGFKFGFGSLF